MSRYYCADCGRVQVSRPDEYCNDCVESILSYLEQDEEIYLIERAAQELQYQRQFELFD